MEKYNKSRQLFEEAQKVIPGGVNSPVRAFKSVGGTPVFLEKAKGAYLYDVDGNRYIDYIGSWGPMVLGHAYEPVVKAIQQQVVHSTSFGAPTELEIKIAELIISMVPNIDEVRMVNSGTEACMSALRLARGYTGKNKFIKFEGNYHGHADPFLVKAGSGVATFNIQQVPGVPEVVAQDTLTAPYNDLEAVKQLVQENKGELAAIILEPVAGNMGCIPPEKGFIEGIRQICDEENIILIFDEVMTGFRLAPGGAQEYLGIKADLVTFGKIIGGGMPVGAFAGRREIMEKIAPSGKIYQAGTLSGNPIAMSAGYTLLKALADNQQIYNDLQDKGIRLKEGLQKVLEEKHIPFQINKVGSMISLHFTKEKVKDFASASATDISFFNKFFHAMLQRGIYLPPSAFESWFISQAHSLEDIDATVQAAKESLQEIC